MFQIKKLNLKKRFFNAYSRKKGSLVLSLVASGAVAATIVATHQLTQRFSSGSVVAFGQQEAFLMAQKSLALAGLMVTRNVVLCSNKMSGGQVEGCNRVGPLNDDLKAQNFYTNVLKLRNNLFEVKMNSATSYAEKYLQFKDSSGHPLFKTVEITWSLRKFDSSLRSVSGPLSKGSVCRNSKTFAVIEEGVCDSMDDRAVKAKLLENRDSRLLSDENKECENAAGNPIPDSVCDYYQDSDGEGVMVFISVKVPYHSTASEEAEGEEFIKYLVANAAVRRPMSIFKIYSAQDKSLCPAGCEFGTSSDSTPTPTEYCQNVGGKPFNGRSNFSDSLPGKKYFSEKGHAAKTEIKIKNYGPGVLYGVHLLKEDINSSEGGVLGRSMIGFEDYLEPADGSSQEGMKSIEHYTPCYSANFYRTGLQKVTCDCEAPLNSSAINTSGGVVCKKGQSVCASTAGNDKNIFIAGSTGFLQDSHNKHEARQSLSKCQFKYSLPAFPALSNSILTAFEKPCESAGISCEFSRINDDQTPGSQKVSWCGQRYDLTTPTGRNKYAQTQVAFPAQPSEGVFPVSSQEVIPVSDFLP